MATVVIAFHRDAQKIGTTVDLDDDEAAALVREGRARYIDPAPATPNRTISAKLAASKSDSGGSSS